MATISNPLTFMKSTKSSSLVFWAKKTSACPTLLAAPVLPHACKNTSGSVGGSICITKSTSGTSMPLAATSVVMRICFWAILSARGAAADEVFPLTVTATGFVIPVRKTESPAAEIVAEKSPVLLCLGNLPTILITSLEKDTSKSLSASSKITISMELVFTVLEDMKSSILPGVAIKICGLILANVSRSSRTAASDPTKSCVLMGSRLSGRYSRRESNTAWIWLANSLVGESTTANMCPFLTGSLST